MNIKKYMLISLIVLMVPHFIFYKAGNQGNDMDIRCSKKGKDDLLKRIKLQPTVKKLKYD